MGHLTRPDHRDHLADIQEDPLGDHLRLHLRLLLRRTLHRVLL
jgi:hypothetical protein